MSDPARAIRAAALLQLLTAAGIALFWIAFYAELFFVRQELESRLANFSGYSAWETAFTLPDLLLACASTAGGVSLLRNPSSSLGRILLSAASGALVFLGVLDANYALRNDLYRIDHPFMLLIGAVAVAVIACGGLTLALLQVARARPSVGPSGATSENGAPAVGEIAIR